MRKNIAEIAIVALVIFVILALITSRADGGEEQKSFAQPRARGVVPVVEQEESAPAESAPHHDEETYPYADCWQKDASNSRWMTSLDIDLASLLEAYPVNRLSTYDGLIANYKAKIKEQFNKKDFTALNWSRFGRLNYIYLVDIPEAAIIDMPIEEAIAVDEAYALYDRSSNVIYLFPGFLTLSENARETILYREIIRSLFDVNDNLYFVEGMAETMAIIATENYGFVGYCGSVYGALCLIKIYGIQVINSVADGSIETLIDASTKPSMGAKLNDALGAIDATYIVDYVMTNEALYVATDILSRAAEHEGANIQSILDEAHDIYFFDADLSAFQ